MPEVDKSFFVIHTVHELPKYTFTSNQLSSSSSVNSLTEVCTSDAKDQFSHTQFKTLGTTVVITVLMNSFVN